MHTQGGGDAQRRLGSPVRILLDVVVGGCAVEEPGVEGLALLAPGKHPRDGAEAHFLLLLFPFLVLQVFQRLPREQGVGKQAVS